jgi:hypothetical protein
MSRLGLAVWVPSAVMVGAVLSTFCVVKLVLEPIDRAVRLART